MELRDYLRILRAHWLGVTLVVLVTVLAAAAYTFTQPKVYAADANGFVSVGGTDNPALGSVNDEFAKSRATSYVDIAKSRATAREVKEALGLEAEPASLVGNISVQQPPDTVLIKITARSGTPREAQALADAWVAALATQVSEIEDPSGNQRAGTPRVIPIESAALPKSPVSPQPVRNLGLSVVLGLLLGLAYAMVRNTLDRRLRTPEAVEQRFDTTVVGTVPMASALGHKQGERAQLVLEGIISEKEAGASEAFRKLRTNLIFMDVDNPPRTIVVTSPRPGDGKSTVAANLAAAIAVSGQRVVLVDADLRRPSIADSFGLVEGAGLTDVLVGRVKVADALQQSAQHENLQILAAGRIPPNPSELLGSRAMRTVVGQLAETALVILDAPPLLPVTDAAVLTASADGALVVISAGQTVDTELGTALSHLEAVRGRALGVILNKAPRSGAGASYGDYYGRYTAEASKSSGEQERKRGGRQAGKDSKGDTRG